MDVSNEYKLAELQVQSDIEGFLHSRPRIMDSKGGGGWKAEAESLQIVLVRGVIYLIDMDG